MVGMPQPTQIGTFQVRWYVKQLVEIREKTKNIFDVKSMAQVATEQSGQYDNQR